MQAGLLVSEGATASAEESEATGNKMGGVIVWGAGSSLAAGRCKLQLNVQVRGWAARHGHG